MRSGRAAISSIAVAAVAVLAGCGDDLPDFEIKVQRSPIVKTPEGYQTVRPTGIGLPLIGVEYGEGDFFTEQEAAIHSGNADSQESVLSEYHDSGAYRQDLRTVGDAAYRTLRRKLDRLGDDPGVRPAVVFDIDETSLSNYALLQGDDFAGFGSDFPVDDDPAIGPSVRLYNLAVGRGVAVHFITGRPEEDRRVTARNLRSVGYDRDWAGLTLKPENSKRTTVEYKSGARERIERDGFTIVLNIGDQNTDLRGGHAQSKFRYPNPFYYVP